MSGVDTRASPVLPASDEDGGTTGIVGGRDSDGLQPVHNGAVTGDSGGGVANARRDVTVAPDAALWPGFAAADVGAADVGAADVGDAVAAGGVGGGGGGDIGGGDMVPPLNLRGVVWKEDSVLWDARTIGKRKAKGGRHKPWHQPTRVRWDVLCDDAAPFPAVPADRTPVDYFIRFLPPALLAEMLAGTNGALVARQQAPMTSTAELRRFLSCMLAMARDGGSGGDAFRSEGAVADGESVGMTRSRFREVAAALRTHVYSDAECRADRWAPMRGVYAHFNAHMLAVVEVGHYIVLDRIVSAWRGVNAGRRDGTAAAANGAGADGSRLRRNHTVGKGEAASVLAAAACGRTHIVVRLELDEGEERMRARYASVLPPPAGTVQRLVAGYRGTGRCVLGDGALFCSVPTALALLQAGLFFIGEAAEATADSEGAGGVGAAASDEYFPLAYLQCNDIYAGDRASWTVLTAHVANRRVHAVGWNSVGQRRYVVFTAGTTVAAGALTRRVKRRRTSAAEQGSAEVMCKKQRHFGEEEARPAVVHELLASYDSLRSDVGGHVGRGGLQLEAHWRTRDWVSRDVATVIGIVETNAFIAYNMERAARGEGGMAHSEFLERLVAGLASSGEVAVASLPVARTPGKHEIRRIAELPWEQEAVRKNKNHGYYRRCVVCGTNTANFCLTCSLAKSPDCMTWRGDGTDTRPEIVGCHPAAVKGCEEVHVAGVHTLRSAMELPYYVAKQRLHEQHHSRPYLPRIFCSVCQTRTSMFCVNCTAATTPDYLTQTFNKRGAFAVGCHPQCVDAHKHRR